MSRLGQVHLIVEQLRLTHTLGLSLWVCRLLIDRLFMTGYDIVLIPPRPFLTHHVGQHTLEMKYP